MKRVPKLLFMPLLLRNQISATHCYMVFLSIYSRLQSVQNTAAWIVTRTRKFGRITPTLKKLHRQPVCYRTLYKILLPVYEALGNGAAPCYISDLLNYHTSQQTLRSSSQHHLATPKARPETYHERKFAVAAPKLWNSILLELTSSSSTDSFKGHLKTSF